jgi:hypothetical protein
LVTVVSLCVLVSWEQWEPQSLGHYARWENLVGSCLTVEMV